MRSWIFFSIFCTLTFTGFCQNKKEQDMVELSKSLGLFIGKQLSESGMQLDMKQVLSGIKEAKKTKIDEEKCLEAIHLLQEIYWNKVKKSNLQKAEEFLSKNSQDKKTIELVKDRLQYTVLKKGHGTKIEKYHTPLVRYQLTNLDGKKIESFSDGRILFFDDLSEGLKQAILGMQKEEKRKIFIHPDLGWGKDHYYHPNSLLIYEIEIIEINKSGKNPLQNREIASTTKA